MENKISVFLVEDNHDMAFFIESFIKKHPEFLLLGSADTLADARIAIAAQKPDLVMLDNYLPDGTGIDIMKHLRTTQPDIDVIFITAANDIDTIKTAIRHGACDYLVKPFMLERLEEALKNYLMFNRKVRQKSHLPQEEIDRVIRQSIPYSAPAGFIYPKGIDELTLNQVRAAFSGENVQHTADSLSDTIGISKSTARRYLEYCKNIKLLEAHIQHGTVGRPQRFYRLTFN
ncbi:response regulator [Dickeya fangzhongdai]|uniref:response regulator n=1 Tax=Dickeya fangzhongdai TaxID=1778540 RepID=UPI0004F74E4F|nr:response regulator [Dickeya fangzhongdai]AIR71208.1 response regulator receiver protein [Dickeya fangzhongdai]KGT99899.1 response regulator receiver protein [Dickeya fangzhongdai]KHN55236.1 response regulator receiver protein [Dickeya fangzhongdai]WPD75305.1 response regulator [Dickeya fangzhongdai]